MKNYYEWYSFSFNSYPHWSHWPRQFGKSYSLMLFMAAPTNSYLFLLCIPASCVAYYPLVLKYLVFISLMCFVYQFLKLKSGRNAVLYNIVLSTQSKFLVLWDGWMDSYVVIGRWFSMTRIDEDVRSLTPFSLLSKWNGSSLHPISSGKSSTFSPTPLRMSKGRLMLSWVAPCATCLPTSFTHSKDQHFLPSLPWPRLYTATLLPFCPNAPDKSLGTCLW